MIECTPIPPYLLFSRHTEALDRLRWRAIALKWRQRKSVSWKVKFVALSIGWPIFATYLSLREIRRYGTSIQQQTGRPIWKQFCEQWMLACWSGVPPHAYYNYALFRPERRGSAHNYVHNPVMTALAYGFRPEAEYTDLHDKVRFEALCRKHSLPTIPIFSFFEGGRVVGGEVDSADHLPEADLFAKPTDACIGRGVLAWSFESSNRYRSSDGTVCTGQDIFRTLAEASRERPYLLQPRIVNHPDLMHLTSGGLCTMRVITGMWPSGEVEVLAAVFKMPRKPGLADNFAAGGIACPIRLSDGRLGTAAGKELTVERISHHPDTGELIEGTVVPEWERVRELCIRAHERLTPSVIIGWDVAATDQGTLLVEGNYKPCMELLQKGGDRPINESPFAPLFLKHLESSPSRSSPPELA